MRVTPIGSLRFDASTSAGVVAYRIYHSNDPNAFDDPNGFYDSVPFFSVPAVEDQEEYAVDLAQIPGAPFAAPGTYYFAAVAESAGGNLSDPTPAVAVVVEEAPLPPTNLRYVPAG